MKRYRPQYDQNVFEAEFNEEEMGQSHKALKNNEGESIIRFNLASDLEYTRQELKTPWMTSRTKSIKDSMLRFHNEIIDFFNYVTPSEKEHNQRLVIFNEIQQLILTAVPQAEVCTFGSFATKLYLSDGDIDVAVLVEEGDYGHITRKTYDLIYSAVLKHKGLEEIQYIRKSKVPLIKFIHKSSQLQFDISVNKQDGIQQLQQVQKMTKKYPEFKYMVMVFKCTLKIRCLGDTYTGGVGSFLLFCMILFYLREMHASGKYYTLGEHVLRFMEYYSISTDWSRKVVLTKQAVIRKRLPENAVFSMLSPQDGHHDIGKSAFKIRDVFSVFKNRFRLIMGCNFPRKTSILKELVNPNQARFKYTKEDAE